MSRVGRWIIFLSKVLPILLACQAYAQIQDSTTSSKAIDFVSIAFGNNQVKDENLHPKVSKGVILSLAYGFEKNKNTFRQFQFALGYSRIKTTFEDLSASANFKIDFNYSYHFSLCENSKVKYYLGPRAALSYTACYFPNWDDSHLYWADYFSISANNVLSVRIKNQNEWRTSLSIPLLSLFSRPDVERLYKIDDVDAGGIIKNLHSDIHPGFWDQVFPLHFETLYRFPAFKHKTEAFTYTLDFLKMKKNGGNQFSQVTQQIGIIFWL